MCLVLPTITRQLQFPVLIALLSRSAIILCDYMLFLRDMYHVGYKIREQLVSLFAEKIEYEPVSLVTGIEKVIDMNAMVQGKHPPVDFVHIFVPEDTSQNNNSSTKINPPTKPTQSIQTKNHSSIIPKPSHSTATLPLPAKIPLPHNAPQKGEEGVKAWYHVFGVSTATMQGLYREYLFELLKRLVPECYMCIIKNKKNKVIHLQSLLPLVAPIQTHHHQISFGILHQMICQTML